ncbi:MAG TPA: ATP-binding cassette domain-containing protein [Gemmatimonadales bacterium]|nr:ATP-binding cassette domain-containing protein [Gemmatimonadales bacterium]
MIFLSARHVTVRFGATVALDSVSLDAPSGSAVAIVGESGSGKTTLLRCFNRMVEPDSGEIRVGETELRTQNRIALRRRLGYAQQNGGLIPHWTVSANVGLVLRALGRPDRPAVAQVMTLVGLPVETFGSRYPHELSGGQRQRVALARALAANPEAILLDEPFGALDAITRAELQDGFDRLRRQLGITVLFVTHDLGEAARLADLIVVLRAGHVEQRGTIAELRDSPATPYVRTLVERALAQGEPLRLP